MKKQVKNLRMEKRKYKMAVFLAVLLGLCRLFYTMPVYAENRVPKMEITVVLQQDGSARITQVWRADTEFYLACHDSGYLSITDFSVADETGAYTFIENWDVNASFEEKTEKCGMVETSEGVELCWGISEYGEKCYTIEYVLHDLAGSYSDVDGFHYRFVDEMSFFPTDIELTICNQDGTPLTDENCDIWAFGYDGQIQFADGMIRAWSEESLESGQHMTLMVSLEKGLISPRRIVEDSFETIKETAFVGSDYDEENAPEHVSEEELTGTDILTIILSMGFLAAFTIVIVKAAGKFQKARENKKLKAVEYFRDAPNNGDLNVTYELGRSCGICREDSLFGAYLLRLISAGCLEPEEEQRNSKRVKLRLLHPPYSVDAYEDVFYTILEAAAGADGVLDSAELEHYTKKNSKPLSKFHQSCVREAKQTLIREGCLKGAVCNGKKDLTSKGKSQLNEILGLKRFLLEFSLIREREVKETILWQDYMVYALLLGIADKVLPQIRELYPEALPQIQHFERYIRYAGCYNTIFYNAYQREQYHFQASRSTGSGGYASFGGGGGFSGGGGGGTR